MMSRLDEFNYLGLSVFFKLFMQANRGGDRFRTRRDFNSRPDDSKSLRVNAPPSRHLWVGNLSHSIDERTLADQFYNFGELENVAFQPGRSYAFVNFKREDEAIAAMRELQGFPLGGMGLKIEFTKAVSFDHYLYLISFYLFHVLSVYMCTSHQSLSSFNF